MTRDTAQPTVLVIGAKATTSTFALLNMKDQMGSYLLYLLTPWVCGMVRNGPFRHDTWVMAPVCEAAALAAAANRPAL